MTGHDASRSYERALAKESAREQYDANDRFVRSSLDRALTSLEMSAASGEGSQATLPKHLNATWT